MFLRVLLVLVLVSAVAGGGAYWRLWHTSAAPMPALTGQLDALTVKVGDRHRSYLTYVPANLPKSAPLMIVLHGTGQDGAKIREWSAYEIDALADRDQFAVAYPNAVKGEWNDCRKTGSSEAKVEEVDDVAFIDAVIARFTPSKVGLFGYSNGGQMALKLAFFEPEKFAAITAAGTNLPMADDFNCPISKPTPPVMLISGTLDPVVLYDGGEAKLLGLLKTGVVRSAADTAKSLAEQNGLTEAPAETNFAHRDGRDETSATHRTWLRDGKPYITLVTVLNGGHTIPQPVFEFPRLLGKTSRDLDAPAEAVKSMLEH